MINISGCNLTDISARSRIDELFPQLRAIDMRGNKLNTIERNFASWIAVDPSSRIFHFATRSIKYLNWDLTSSKEIPDDVFELLSLKDPHSLEMY